MTLDPQSIPDPQTQPSATTPANGGTLGDYLAVLRHRCRRDIWPPDLFGVCAALVTASGGFSQAVETMLSSSKPPFSAQQATELAKQWAELGDDECPPQVSEILKQIEQKKGLQIACLARESDIIDKLLFLIVTIDTLAQYRIGAWYASAKLDPSQGEGFFSTLGKELPENLVKVLPKSLPPQVGLSLRSLTKHLAVWTNADVKPAWYSVIAPHCLETVFDEDSKNGFLNVLLYPWPMRLDKNNFSEVKGKFRYSSGYKTFGYRPTNDPPVRLPDLVQKARSIVGPIHAVVMPEGAMSPETAESIEQTFQTANVDPPEILIFGVVDGDLCRNYVRTLLKHPKSTVEDESEEKTERPPFEYRRIDQDKHHRWKIDDSQVFAYGLHEVLDPNYEWWEAHKINDRKVGVYEIRDFVIANVICEDLARQDPTNDFLRTIGPNFVIAILMDNVQTPNRWPARYATILADDPGCSVLTLTSLGMIRLCEDRRHKQEDPRFSIGLWKDRFNGVQEIKIDDDADAVLLRLELKSAFLSTLDGRKGSWQFVPVLSHQPVSIRLDQGA
jgi:hypothetical protein